jgi:GDSL-like Lipase/Acylhydrolase family
MFFPGGEDLRRETTVGKLKIKGQRQSLRRIKIIYSFFLFSVIGTAVVSTDLAVPTYKTGLSREMFLMGFAATANSLVDDTPINSMGFTGDVVDLSKPPQTIRILTLGGSAMFNRRMTERLKSGFNAVSSQRVEIIGGALRTHTTASSVLKYKLFSKYSPDFVLIYHGINDLWANHVASEDFRADYSHLNPWYKRNFCLDYSAICRVIYNKWIYRKPPTVLKTAFHDLPGQKVFRGNLMTLINTVRANGSIPILMTFAWAIPDNYTIESFKSGSSGYNNPTKYDSWPVELWGPEEYVREGLRTHNRIVGQIATANNVLLIDQEKLIGKDLYWFGDLCHLSEEGTERFIDNIVNFFIDHGFISPAAQM